uniref:Uncharacterized protein n=1 Tax=Siphoviridae sp. ctZZK17 TaxID=2826384 RepID=A0A8S5MPC6_9CAUD|nr:MAG TPA: hypothetical protein [Siphoviridae sp. ctZZK17]DAY64287.1 MAG TPA: hypothetical protein [Caudoviricetes sp.]
MPRSGRMSHHRKLFIKGLNKGLNIKINMHSP